MSYLYQWLAIKSEIIKWSKLIKASDSWIEMTKCDKLLQTVRMLSCLSIFVIAWQRQHRPPNHCHGRSQARHHSHSGRDDPQTFSIFQLSHGSCPPQSEHHKGHTACGEVTKSGNGHKIRRWILDQLNDLMIWTYVKHYSSEPFANICPCEDVSRQGQKMTQLAIFQAHLHKSLVPKAQKLSRMGV